MNAPETSRGTLHFTLWGIPISIQPSSWIVLALLGGAFRINDGSDLKNVLIFVAAGMLCLLAHELGHALTGRKLTGETPTISLAMMGGVTMLHNPPRTRMGYFQYILAGPLAGLIPGLAAALLLGMQIGHLGAGISFFFLSPFGAESALPSSHVEALVIALHEGTLSYTALQIYATTTLISVWWCIFNLLPIFPMDGGQILLTITNNYKTTALIGLILAGILTIVSISLSMWFTMMLLGYFAYINWQIFRSSGE